MGKRGPRPDPAQAAKGFPGRRRSKAEKAAEDVAQLAKLLAPAVGPIGELPAMLQDPKYAPAAVVWRKLAPELRRTHRLPVEAEFHFVQVCIYTQEWAAATEDLHAKGFTQNVKTVAGGSMERRRPKNFERQAAFQALMELSGKFGLTPHDLYALFKGQAAVATSHPSLFGEDRKAPAAEPETPAGRIGGMGRLRSTPPDPRPN